MSAPVVSVLADSNIATCHDVSVGSPLGSKSAGPPTYAPGTCKPSGGPTGSVTPIGPGTLCCIPPPL